MSAIFPDAYVKHGIIYDLKTHEELPSYSGLCLADLAGRQAIMFTSLGDARQWDFVHWGSTLSTTEIAKYLKENHEPLRNQL